MKRRIVSVLLCMVVVFVFLIGNCRTVFAQESQLDKILNFAKSKIGSTEYVGRCQAFVYQCYKAGGIDNGSASSAIAAWRKWGVSTSKTNIPIGACVYFDENVGSEYGHVGIYVGNNKMIHSRQSVGAVVESSMTWYFNNCYLGWGWQGGVQPSASTTQTPSTSVVADYYKLTSPDGYQTVRSEATTDSANVGTLNTGDVVCVTKYNSDHTWGYINNGVVSGWIRLYYVTATSHSHSYGAWATTKEATCTTNGTKAKKCTGCSTTETKTIPATGHSYGSWTTTKEATCTAAGSKQRKCACGHTETTQIDALGHSYSNSYTTEKEPTCTQAGSKYRKCTKCSAKTDVTSIQATGHSYGNWKTVLKESCTADGRSERSCTCGVKEYKAIAATGHMWSKWTVTKEATTEHAGEEARKCSLCSKQEVKATPKLSVDGHKHIFSENSWVEITPATCTQEGRNERYCSLCNAADVQVTPALSHVFSDWQTVLEPTAEQEGTSVRSCNRCNQTEELSLPKLNTPDTTPTTEPTELSDSEPMPSIDITVQPDNPSEDNSDKTTILIILASVGLLFGLGSTSAFIIYLIKKKK